MNVIILAVGLVLTPLVFGCCISLAMFKLGETYGYWKRVREEKEARGIR